MSPRHRQLIDLADEELSRVRMWADRRGRWQVFVDGEPLLSRTGVVRAFFTAASGMCAAAAEQGGATCG